MDNKFDIIIVGGGIVGLSTAYNILLKAKGLKVAILEKESKISQHQTGHNSGVIHSGIYYKPGSLKSINCKKGYDLLLNFVKKYDVPFELCGKIIVATKDSEKPSLDNIFNRGVANGLAGIRKISVSEIKEIEPHVKSVDGIFVPQTGIIDYRAVTAKYLELFEQMGGTIVLNSKVLSIVNKGKTNVIQTENQEFVASSIVNCCGLYSDKIAKILNPEIDIQIVPFRGEYYELRKDKEYLVKNLIYPVPNPDFPFLGVHFTRMIGGGIEAGPNAVLAFKREGYKRTDWDSKEFFEIVGHKGFRTIARKYWRDGLGEMYRSYFKFAFVKALQGLIPEIVSDDLFPGGAGVRAQACDSKGNLLDDFAFFDEDRVINVCNAPSPAATSSLAIGQTISDMVINKFSK